MNIRNGWIYDLCPDEMTPNHIGICPGRNAERNYLDMNNLDDLMTLRQFWLGCWSSL